jgi:hypothetical protein
MTEQAYRNQARRNYGVYQELKVKPCLDWAATVLFYAALHDVNAWFMENNYGEPFSHSTRAKYMTRAKIPAKVFAAYERLRSVSYTARYLEWQGSIDIGRIEDLEKDEYETVREHFK